MGSPVEVQHRHHPTKASHKAFKSRYASKSSIKAVLKGKIEKGQRRTPHQQVMSKLDRRNQARQKQQEKHRQLVKARRIFSGHGGVAKRVVLVPVHQDVDPMAAIGSLNSSLDVSEPMMLDTNQIHVNIERFKQQLEYVVPQPGLFSVLDACRLADFVLFLFFADGDIEEDEDELLRAVEGQGVTSVVAMIQGLDKIQPLKRRQQTLSSLKAQINRYFPEIDKLLSLGSRQECINVMRSLCTNMPRGIRWRDDRSWLSVEHVQWPAHKSPLESDQAAAEPLADAVFTGTVRGKGFKADRLVQLDEGGVYQVDKIVQATSAVPHKARHDDMTVDIEAQGKILDQATQDQDDLADLAPFEPNMTDVSDAAPSRSEISRKGVLLDDHHYFSEEDLPSKAPPKRLPKGTSAYQAAWYLDDDSDSSFETDEPDEDGDLAMDSLDETGETAQADGPSKRVADTEGAPSIISPSDMFLDPSPEDEMEQVAAFRLRQRNEAQDDLEFPDEIELSPQVIARERLARYRGLKSLRTSPWETEEDKPHEPEDWDRLLRFRNYKGTKNRVIREALVGGVPAGTKVHVHLRNVPLSLAGHDLSQRPLGLYSLLRHEHKRTVVNVSITLDSAYPQPIKSKEELILQLGPRRFVIHPLFSQPGQTPNNVHKYDRYLHPGRSAVATFIGPVTWGAVPALFFKRRQQPPLHPASSSPSPSSSREEEIQLIGHGTNLPPDDERVIAKRIILTGHPYKIHKNVVTVRYMFFNAPDVHWFKALPLWTKRGRAGFIKESLGTHGYFKATFNGPINPQDTVCVSLYKRVWPRPARSWSGMGA